MKAAVLRTVGHLTVEEVPPPEADEGGVLVKVEACAICSTDVKIYRHGYSGFEPPLILGHELAGTIASVAPKVRGWRKGDRVAVGPNIACGECWFCRRGLATGCDNLRIIGVHMDGAFAEFVRVPAEAVRAECLNRIPAGVSFEEAALIDPISCAVNASELSGVKAGDTVVVIGAGPTGCMNVEVAKSCAARVILVQRSVKRLEDAAFTGADVCLSPTVDDVTARVREETSGRGADAVIVCCNAPEAQQDALQLVRKRGSVNFFGGLPKDSPHIQLNSNLVHYGEFSITGTHGGSSEHCRKALGLIAEGKVKAKRYLTHRFPLAQLLEGIAVVEGKQGLKVIVNP